MLPGQLRPENPPRDYGAALKLKSEFPLHQLTGPLASQPLQMRPGLKVLLTSGYARTLLGEDNPPGPLLSKPYRKSDLARAFERLGEEGEGAA